MRWLSVVIALVLLPACVSTTVITSSPSGARVYVDGVLRGQTPLTYSEQVNASTRHTLKLAKDGYRDVNASLAADQWNAAKVAVSVLCCLPGLVFSTEFAEAYSFVLESQPGGAAPDAPGYPGAGYPGGGYPTTSPPPGSSSYPAPPPPPPPPPDAPKFDPDGVAPPPPAPPAPK